MPESVARATFGEKDAEAWIGPIRVSLHEIAGFASLVVECGRLAVRWGTPFPRWRVYRGPVFGGLHVSFGHMQVSWGGLR